LKNEERVGYFEQVIVSVGEKWTRFSIYQDSSHNSIQTDFFLLLFVAQIPNNFLPIQMFNQYISKEVSVDS